jgi:hypothetical protein
MKVLNTVIAVGSMVLTGLELVANAYDFFTKKG